MSKQRVLRAVRLLPQAVKIGLPEEPEEPVEIEQGAPESADPLPPKAAAPKPAAPPPPSPLVKGLRQKVDELQASLEEAQAQNAGLAEAKKKLESEIGGIRADYEGRRKALEAESAAAAQKAAEEARAQAREEGLKAGHDEGLSAARAEVEKEYHDKFSSLVAQLEGMGRRLEENFAELTALNQPRMIRLWKEMLRRMLGRQVELNPDTVTAVLSDLLALLSDKNQIVIYASPDDVDHLQEEMDKEKGQFQEVLRGVHHLDLKADPNVEPGSCIVETKLGVYDARWRTQLGQVESVVDNIFQQLVKEENKGPEPEGQAPEPEEKAPEAAKEGEP